MLLLCLWTLDARVVVETLVWSLVAIREPPIPLWVVPRIVVESRSGAPNPLWVVPRIVVESRSGTPNPIVGCALDYC